MTKLDLQKELLEKVKPGMKPSDIKKLSKNQVQEAFNPPLLRNDEGYSSDEGKNLLKAPSLPNQDLINQLTSLKKQLQTYKDFKDADLKIKERYKETISKLEAKIKEQDGVIAELKNTAKTPAEIKNPPTYLEKLQEPKQYLFTCDICEQTKKSQLHLGKVNGLGIDPLKENKICFACIRKVDLIQPPKEDFF